MVILCKGKLYLLGFITVLHFKGFLYRKDWQIIEGLEVCVKVLMRVLLIEQCWCKECPTIRCVCITWLYLYPPNLTNKLFMHLVKQFSNKVDSITYLKIFISYMELSLSKTCYYCSAIENFQLAKLETLFLIFILHII